MSKEKILLELRSVFSTVEETAGQFTPEQFFKRPVAEKWSAAENVQHLFLSAKPLVGLFGKPEMMLQNWGPSNRTSMSYDQVVAMYLEKIGSLGAAVPAFVPDTTGVTQSAVIENLHSIHTKFLERASQLSEADLDHYQIPHPLIGLLTAREFLYFTHYHTTRHNNTVLGLHKG